MEATFADAVVDALDSKLHNPGNGSIGDVLLQRINNELNIFNQFSIVSPSLRKRCGPRKLVPRSQEDLAIGWSSPDGADIPSRYFFSYYPTSRCFSHSRIPIMSSFCYHAHCGSQAAFIPTPFAHPLLFGPSVRFVSLRASGPFRQGDSSSRVRS